MNNFGYAGRTLESFEPNLCSVCGKDMRNDEDHGAFIGVSISIDISSHAVADADAAKRILAFYKEQLGVYAPLLGVGKPVSLDVCWECCLKSLGIPVPEGEE